MIQEAIFSLITGDAGIDALIEGRCYPGILPEKEPLPAIRYAFVSGDRASSQAGDSALEEARVQIDCWDHEPKYDAAKALAKKVRELLHGYKGTVGTTVISSVFLVTRDRDLFSDKQKAWQIGQDFVFRFCDP